MIPMAIIATNLILTNEKASIAFLYYLKLILIKENLEFRNRKYQELYWAYP